MTGNVHTDIDSKNEFDPATVADRPAVEYTERTIRHEDADHCEADVAGRAIVGVTDPDDRTLLLVDRELPGAFLPNGTVEPGEDWRGAAERAVEAMTGVAVRVERPVQVRRVEHLTESTGERHNVSYHAVFAGTPSDATVEPTSPEETCLEAGWFGTLPVEIPQETEQGYSLADVEAFLE